MTRGINPMERCQVTSHRTGNRSVDESPRREKISGLLRAGFHDCGYDFEPSAFEVAIHR